MFYAEPVQDDVADGGAFGAETGDVAISRDGAIEECFRRSGLPLVATFYLDDDI